MAHRCTEVVVPIRAMQPITLVVIHRVGDIGQIVAGTGHERAGQLDINAELPLQSGIRPGACGDDEATDWCSTLISDHALGAKVDIDPTPLVGQIFRIVGVAPR